MRYTFGLALAAVLSASATAMAQGPDSSGKPTIVLVHGAFADSSGWNDVITILAEDGYRTIAAANPLRGVANDAATVASILKTVEGDVVLVAHSYGGMVISQAAEGQANVRALVYIDGFMPEPGENAFDLAGKFPGSVVGDSLFVVPLSDDVQDAYLQTDKFPAAFAADVPVELARLMAVTQRPLTIGGGYEPATAAAWKTLPTWSIWGSDDLIIPAALHAWQAERADVVKAVEIEGGSHALMVSRPAEVASIIEEAAESVSVAVAAAR
jgi:pimeloyl-ACP methyl ester carboxylesterase